MSQTPTGAGALVLHGLTGTPETVAPLAAALRAAGVAVAAPLLPGHGADADALARTRYEDWLEAASACLAGLAERCARLVLVGHSMGGTLCLDLASCTPELCGVVVVNPLVEPPHESVLELLHAGLGHGVGTVHFRGADLKRDDLDYRGATEVPIDPLCSLLEVLPPLASRLSAISAPVLVLSSAVDHVVPNTSGEFLLSHLQAPSARVVLAHSYHLATLDHDGPEVARLTVDFVTAHTAPTAHHARVALGMSGR